MSEDSKRLKFFQNKLLDAEIIRRRRTLSFSKSQTTSPTFLIPNLSNTISVDTFLPNRSSDVVSFRSNKRINLSVAKFFGSVARTFGSVARTFGSVARTFESVARTFGFVARTSGSVARTFGSVARTFGSVARTFGSVARTFGSVARTSGSVARTFGSVARTFEAVLEEKLVFSLICGNFQYWGFGMCRSISYTDYHTTNNLIFN